MPILNELENDLLTEVFNLGMGKAAAALSEMVQEEILLSIPDITFMSKTDAVLALAKHSPGNVSGVSQCFKGLFSGEALLLFPEEKSLDLVRLLLQDTAHLENLTELEEEALKEIGNIILNAGLSSLADLFDIEIETFLPEFRQGSCKQILYFNGHNHDDEVLLLRVDFKLEKHAVDGHVIFLFDAHSSQALVKKINQFLDTLKT